MLRTRLYSQLVTAISPFLFHLILILYNEEANTGGQWTGGRRRPILSPPFHSSWGFVKFTWRAELCVDFVGMKKCERRWGKLEVFLFVIGSLTMLRTCRRSNELENAWRKREAAIWSTNTHRDLISLCTAEIEDIIV